MFKYSHYVYDVSQALMMCNININIVSHNAVHFHAVHSFLSERLTFIKDTFCDI